MNYYENKKTDKEKQIIYLSLKQVEIEFDLELKIDTHEGLSNVVDLNTLLEPTHVTDTILMRWKIVREIDPNYPYPESEIKKQDWMGMNQFLHGEDEKDEGNKPDMIYDEEGNIYSDIFNYIMNGTQYSHPVVEEAIERIDK